MSLRDRIEALASEWASEAAARRESDDRGVARLFEADWLVYERATARLRAALAADAAHAAKPRRCQCGHYQSEHLHRALKCDSCPCDAFRAPADAAHGDERARVLENEEADRLVAPLFADDGKRNPIRALSSEAEGRCQCGHAKRDHGHRTGCWFPAHDRDDGRCDCRGFRPGRSVGKP